MWRRPRQTVGRIKLSGSTTVSKNPPLILIDDCAVTDVEFRAINPDDIQSIDVFKNADAIKRYGIVARHGVISIKMKVKNFNQKTKAAILALTPAP